MKKRVISILVVIIMMINQVMVIAAGVTSYPGKSMALENGENVDIVYNEVLIDTETSNISNMYILQNTSSSDTVIKASIPLENLVIGNKVENLEIKVNNAKIKYEIEKTDEEVLYKFDIKAKPNEVKKVEIKYKTENDLTEATIIRYNMEGMKLGDKKIKKVKVDVKIREKDIPMVTSIYPPHYTFDLDTKLVTVEYYNMPINNLTKNIIIEKIAYESLAIDRELSEDVKENEILYGLNYANEVNEKVLSGYTKLEFYNRINNYIAKNIDSLLNTEMTAKKLLNDSKISDKYKDKNGYDYEYFYAYNYKDGIKMLYNLAGYIDDYNKIKKYVNSKQYNELGFMKNSNINVFKVPELLNYLIDKYMIYEKPSEEKAYQDLFGCYLYGKVICIDSVYRQTYDNELESNSPNNNKMVPKSEKEPENIYGYETITKEYTDEETGEVYYRCEQERRNVDISDALAAYSSWSSNGGARLIFLNEMTNENISNKERAEYVNSIGADLYVRYDICDLTIGEENKEFGYNNEAGYKFIEYILNNNELYGWDKYKWVNEELVENPEYKINNYIKKVDDDTGLNYSKVPAIIMYRGNIYYNEEDNNRKYYSYNYDFLNILGYFDREIFDIKEVKQMIDSNKKEIEQTKNDINTEIERLVSTIIDDKEEIQSNDNMTNKENIIYIVIGSCLLIGIIICISILIIKNKKGGSKYEK